MQSLPACSGPSRSRLNAFAFQALLAATALSSVAALAQTALPPASNEEIVVTGSRIPRPTYERDQPVVTVTSATIEARAFSSVAAALNELPGSASPIAHSSAITAMALESAKLRQPVFAWFTAHAHRRERPTLCWREPRQRVRFGGRGDARRFKHHPDADCRSHRNGQHRWRANLRCRRDRGHGQLHLEDEIPGFRSRCAEWDQRPRRSWQLAYSGNCGR